MKVMHGLSAISTRVNDDAVAVGESNLFGDSFGG